MMDFLIFSLLLLMAGPPLVWSHARLMSPPSRSSMWRLGFSTRKNFNDNALYCGGISIQWQKNGGKCGICGDPYNMPHPRDNEAGGKYGRGIISKRYKSGQAIEVTVDVTTNHRGYFEFRICPNNNPKKEASQECLDKYLLKEAHGTGTRYFVGDKGNGNITVKIQLPKGLTCSQCVFQWTYVAGNNWGKCDDGVSRLGCGPQETFRGCADVAIEKNAGDFDFKHNENDVENKPHKEHNHKNKKHGHSKGSTANTPDYTYGVTKHIQKDENRTISDKRNSQVGGRFHIENGDTLPHFSQKPEYALEKHPISNERRHYAGAGRRKYHKFDSRHFHYHSYYPSGHQNHQKNLLSTANRWSRTHQNNNKNTKRPQHLRKKYDIKELNRPVTPTRDNKNDGLIQGFNLGGRRYKDFWFL